MHSLEKLILNKTPKVESFGVFVRYKHFGIAKKFYNKTKGGV